MNYYHMKSYHQNICVNLMNDSGRYVKGNLATHTHTQSYGNTLWGWKWLHWRTVILVILNFRVMLQEV